MTSAITYKDLGQNQLKIVFYIFFSPIFTSFYGFFVLLFFCLFDSVLYGIALKFSVFPKYK